MKLYLVAGIFFLALQASAQKTPQKPVVTKTAIPKPLKNNVDSISYAIGLMVANFYKQQGISNLNSTVIAKACNDVFGKKKTLLTESEANMTLMRYLNPALTKNVEEGEKFLAANRTRPNVKTTRSGLQYEVLVEGKGPKPTPVDTVTVNYVGTLLNGTTFDKNNGISFSVGGVIAGWTEALQLMPAGSKYKLYIPYQLAYGPNDNGPIPGGSLLVFEVELLKIKGKDN